MDKQAGYWLLALCLGAAAWLYWDVSSMQVDYDLHSWLVEPETGAKLKPSELIDYMKFIKHTEDYINRTDALDRLYDLEYNLNLGGAIMKDEIYSSHEQLLQSGWPVANQTQCGQQLDWIVAKLAENKDYALLKGRVGYELARYMDAFGRPESGSLTGNVVWPGLYNQCLESTLDGGRIKTRYCWIRFRPRSWPADERVYPRSRIKIGACLPEVCDTSSFDRHAAKIELLVKQELPEFYRRELVFESMFCLPDERSPIRQLPTASKIFLCLVGGWLALVVIASIMYRGDERSTSFGQSVTTTEGLDEEPLHKLRYDLISALAIQRTMSEFASVPIKAEKRKLDDGGSMRAVNLAPLDFLKVVMCLMLVYAHSWLLHVYHARSRSNKVHEIGLSDMGLLAASSMHLNNNFFVLSGLLGSYLLLRRNSAQQLSSLAVWFKYYTQRLIKSAPVYMLVFWYAKLISAYTSHGPWWDYGFSKYSMVGQCRGEPWWKSIPHLGVAFNHGMPRCNAPGWYLVAYSKLYFLIPLVTYIIYKLPSRKTRFMFIGYIALLSNLQLLIKAYKQISYKPDAPVQYGLLFADLLDKYESTGTFSALGRLITVAFGCYIGYYLRMFELGKVARLPEWCTNRLAMVSIVLMQCLIFYLPVLVPRLISASGHIPATAEFMSIYIIIYSLWVLIFGLQIIGICTHDKDTAFIRLANHPFWHVCNKLTMAIYLIHWQVMTFALISYEQGSSLGSLGDVLKLWAVGVFFTIPIAFIVHILIEAPLIEVLSGLRTALHYSTLRDIQASRCGYEERPLSPTKND